MSETPNLNLPLVAASQAQKHVTVNEALARIDATLQLSVVSRTVVAPPAATEGEVYLIPAGASGDWSGQDGALAFAVGAGWDFLQPIAGWRVWVADEAKWISFDGSHWLSNVVATTANGAGLRAEVVEVDVTVDNGDVNITTDATIPAYSVVLAVTGRVISGFDGTLSDWSLGVDGSANRYGSGLGVGTGAYLRGLTGQPQSYYADTPLVITGNGGDVGTGQVRLAIHTMQFDIPRL